MSARQVSTADVVAMLYQIGAEKREERQATACFVRDCAKHHPHPATWRRKESSRDR